ncbi:spike base protein, RCAP_Rcc01079 family [Rhizobium mesoamericanum]|uniref:spike base protein, RCAP_Rcc01079 family n=1 Tax=Rhizobium mesoamericanum TaxID=1079800 RepID=UPI003F9E30C7
MPCPSLIAPTSAGFVSPNDNLDLTEIIRALYIGIGRDLAVTMASGRVLTFSLVPDGSMLPLRISRVPANRQHRGEHCRAHVSPPLRSVS